MNAFFDPLIELREFEQVNEAAIKKSFPLALTGCIDGQREQIIAALARNYTTTLVVTENEIRARQIMADLSLYCENVDIYPAKDALFYSADIHGNNIESERMKIVQNLTSGRKQIVVLSAQALWDYLMPMENVSRNMLEFKVGECVDIDEISRKLVDNGYIRQDQVGSRGEFAVRGGIIDIFPLTIDVAYRIELFGDEIDTIRTFDTQSQRTVEDGIETVSVFPASGYVFSEAELEKGKKKIREDLKLQIKKLRDLMKNEEAKRIETATNQFLDNMECYAMNAGIESYVNYFKKDMVSLLDYLDMEDSIIFIDEPARTYESINTAFNQFGESMAMRLEKGYILPGQVSTLWQPKKLFSKMANMSTVLISTLGSKIDIISPKLSVDFTVKGISNYNNNFEMLVKELTAWKNQGYRVVLVCSSSARAMHIASDLRDYELNANYSRQEDKVPQPKEILVTYGSLLRGFEYPMIKYAVVSESDIFKQHKKKRTRSENRENTQKLLSFNDLDVGDYVVHENHGIGLYKGIEKIEVDNIVKDYIKLEYADKGVLYVPTNGLDVIAKFSSAKDAKPKLNKLNSVEWHKTKTRVKTAVRDIANELVSLYAARQEKQGFRFDKDSIWQREFEDSFMFEETKDQLDAIEATKADMESGKIMDRLICGDVGFGKTEIAIRAAFKAALSGKQVAFLVPTTILAKQHYNTFSQRMKDYPANVEMLSRFKTPKEQTQIVKKLATGEIDIIIGTHALLSEKIKFKDLGLLIIDEEQRFGVTHKEKIKHIKENVDVLTLSATPIPRTLNMSLIGIRDMSVLTQAPVDRMPIQTYVMEYDEQTVREAVLREVSRGGQVYFISNRVNDIAEVTNRIATLIPEANVAFAHGQMPQRQLENVMLDFINGDIDVLISTTIVETGLDIANVNTMIIDDADHFGLSQLYQLRGRVGRSNKTAFAFLMYKRDKMIREVAEKRLNAIREFTELGSGIKIAMKDLEIRGAGNLLGEKQHGHMEAVGYDLYCKLLNEEVMKLKGVEPELDFETTIDVNISAYIPSKYISNEYTKLEMYKKISLINDDDDVLNVTDELIDRFGEMPDCVNNLIKVASLKALAHKLGIVQVIQKDDVFRMIMFEKADIDVAAIPDMLKAFKGKLKFSFKKTPCFEYKMEKTKGFTLEREMDSVYKILKEVLNTMLQQIIIKEQI